MVDAHKQSPAYASYLRPNARAKRVPVAGKLRGALFVFDGELRTPEWSTYLSTIAGGIAVPAVSSTGAILLLRPPGTTGVTYACAWGAAHMQLRRDSMTPDLGVKVAFNLLSEASATGAWQPMRVRSVRTKSLSEDRLLNEAQSPRDAQISAFGLDTRKDLLRGITGQPTDAERWGRLVTGSASIQVKRPQTASELIGLCADIEQQYHSTAYKAHFAWIDDLRAIVDAATCAKVIGAAVSLISNGQTSDLDLCPPDLIDWGRVRSFTYSIEPNTEYADPSLDDFVGALKRSNALVSLTTEAIENEYSVVALDSEVDGQELESWSVLECLSGTVPFGGQMYVLEAGAVYAVTQDYLAELNAFVDSLAVDRLGLPPFTGSADEKAYNKAVAQSFGGVFLDGIFVQRAGESEIEICDIALVSPSTTLLHVKRGKGSGKTSYVLAQAAVSAELLAFDTHFCKAANARILALNTPKHFFGKSSPLTLTKALTPSLSSANRRLAIGLVASWKSNALLSSQLSFFSKISTRMTLERLSRYGFDVSIERIAN